MRHRKRAGFTLFQLLLVLAVLLILIGLLLPAVQKVRESAARMQSQNNLKQLGVAAHNYASTFNSKLPSGVNSKNFSVLYHLLPYIEQDNVYQKIDATKSVDDKDNEKMRGVLIKTFLNPQDPLPPPNMNWGPTNYMGNAGTKASLEDNNGIFYKDSAINIGAIPDGTSNTLMFIETLKGDGGKVAVSVARQYVKLDKKALKGIKDDAGVKDFKANKHIAGDRGASWMDGRFLQASMTLTRKANDPRPDVSCGGEGGLAGPRTLTAGVSVGMCDGSVRFVSKSVSLKVWQAVSTRDGGEELPGDF